MLQYFARPCFLGRIRLKHNHSDATRNLDVLKKSIENRTEKKILLLLKNAI